MYEEALNDQNNTKLDGLMLQANKLYREIQSKYISKKFDNLNQKLDDKINATENSTSELMFNIISIFLGITITTSMVAGLEFIEGTFIIFYFLSCAWITLTILMMSSLLLRSSDKKNIIVVVIWFLFTTLWAIIGIKSYDKYDKEVTEENKVSEKDELNESTSKNNEEEIIIDTDNYQNISSSSLDKNH